MPIDSPIQLFSDEGVSTAPDMPGVYALLCAGEIILYGNSDVSVRTALQSHWRGEDDSVARIATHFQAELSTEPGLREEELLREYQESHGAYPWCNEMTEAHA